MDREINCLTKDSLNKLNPLTSAKSHIDKWSNYKSAELDTEGVNLDTRCKREFNRQSSFNKASSKSADGSFTTGYSLFLKYRHVYAGTGNWFKHTPYKHAYPPRGSASINSSRTLTEKDAENKKLLHRREVMKKLANNLQLTKSKDSRMERNNQMSSTNGNSVLTTSGSSDENRSGDSDRSLPKMTTERYHPAYETRNDSLMCRNQHEMQATDNNRNLDKNDVPVHLNRNESKSISKESTDFERRRFDQNLIDCGNHEKDDTFTSKNIDTYYTSIKVKPFDKLKNLSVATEFSRVNASTVDSEQTVKEISRGKELGLVNGDLSTRAGMKMLSRLSLEARTAMYEAKRETENRRDAEEESIEQVNTEKARTSVSQNNSNDSRSIEEISTSVNTPRSKSKTPSSEGENHKECGEVRRLSDVPVDSCLNERKKHFMKPIKEKLKPTIEKDIQIIKHKGGANKPNLSVSVDKGLTKKHRSTLKKNKSCTQLHEEMVRGDGKDYLRTLTKNDNHISNNGFSTNKVVPLSMLGREGTFHITPAGYDSRFSDQPIMLDINVETSQEIRQMAIQKCNDWLLKHT